MTVMPPDGPACPRFVLEDPSLPHQIILRVAAGGSHLIAVSCNCMRPGGAAIEMRARWEAAEAIAAWRAHMEEIGEPAA